MNRWSNQSHSLLLAVTLVALAWMPAAAQTFNSGSTGVDGAFNPTSNTTLTLPPTGLFNFTTITIPSGVTVTFTRNAVNTPAILLATGNVTISGTINVSGGAGGAIGRPGLGGPGGFDGGPGGDGVTTANPGAGLGPGGGLAGVACPGTAGSYGTWGEAAFYGCATGGSPGPQGPLYGGPALRPILGGSGGSGGSAAGVPGSAGGAGGGGGGALLIASSGTITLNSTGQLLADGGAGGAGAKGGGGGSGGAIRLIATAITSNGALYARGGSGGQYGAGTGGLGRIRLEAYTLTVSGTRSPEPTQAFPQPVFLATGQPTLTIASVAGIAAPASPSGSLLAAPDILLPTTTTNPIEVVLTASNIPLGTAVTVTATPQSGSKATATSTGLTGSLGNSTATASITLSLSQVSVLTATATFPLVASAGEGPLYADGEEVTYIKVAALLGGGSTVTYLTRSGREVPSH